MEEILRVLEELRPLLSYVTVDRIMIAVVILMSLRNGQLIKRAIRVSERTNQRFSDYLQQDAVL